MEAGVKAGVVGKEIGRSERDSGSRGDVGMWRREGGSNLSSSWDGWLDGGGTLAGK